MTNAFVEASSIEARGQRVLLPWLRHRFSEVVAFNSGPSHLKMQKQCDLVAESKDGGHFVCVELKIEESNAHGNLFLESFSNKSRCNPGWLFKCEADLLLYYFIETDDLLTLSVRKLKAWAFSNHNGSWAVASYPERGQGKYQQLNDTWGWCVPIEQCLSVAAVNGGRYSPKRECYEDPFLRAQIQTREEWLAEYDGVSESQKGQSLA